MDTQQTNLSPEEITSQLSTFHGTSEWHRYSGAFFPFTYTDGVAFLIEQCKCHWMLDILASYQFDQKVRKEPFQVYEFTKHNDDSLTIVIEDGNNNELARQEVEFTDFPLDEITLWLVNRVALLPSEY